MRLFLAIEIPEGWRSEAHAATAALAARHGESLRLVRPELLHVTVRFLGEVADERVESLTAELAATVPPVDVELGLTQTGTFGPASRTGAVWLGVGGDVEGLRALARRVEAGLVAAGVPAEERELRPHLTIARVRQRVAAGERRAIAEAVRALAPPAARPVRVQALAFVRSRLGSGEPRYEVLARF